MSPFHFNPVGAIHHTSISGAEFQLPHLGSPAPAAASTGPSPVTGPKASPPVLEPSPEGVGKRSR